MITLDSVLKSLEIKLAGAATTTELPYVSAYVDLNQSTWALTGAGEQDGVTTGGTAKEVVAAPGATTSRKLNYLSVVNVDTVPAVLTVQVNNNATKRIVFSATLAVGDQLSYTDAFGWKLFDSSGNQKTTMQIAPLSITNAMLAGSIAASKLIATDFTAITLSGVLTTSGGIALGVDDTGIYQNTADGADTRAAWFAGGGIRNRSRGGYLYVTGNENGEPGIVRVQMGNVAGSVFEVDLADGSAGFVLSNIGVLTVNGFGTHTFSAGANADQKLTIVNTTSGTAARANLTVTAGTSNLFFTVYSQGYTSAGGFNEPSSSIIYFDGSGGFSFAAGDAAGTISFYSGGTTLRARINANGTQTWAPYGAGAATFDASGNITSVSDLRDKDVIGPYPTGLAALRHLAPIRYRWKAAKGLDRGRTYIGFGAQDVLPWVPDAVDQHWLPDSTDATAIGEDRYSFNPIVLLAVLINAMKELELRVDALDGRRVPDPTPIRAQDFQAAIGLDATLLDPLDLAQKVRRTGTGRFPPPPPETRP